MGQLTHIFAKLIESLESGSVKFVVRFKGDSKEIIITLDGFRRWFNATMSWHFSIHCSVIGKLDIIRRRFGVAWWNSFHIKIGEGDVDTLAGAPVKVIVAFCVSRVESWPVGAGEGAIRVSAAKEAEIKKDNSF